MMDEMMRKAFRSSRSPFETSNKVKSFRPHVYGFSISMHAWNTTNSNSSTSPGLLLEKTSISACSACTR